MHHRRRLNAVARHLATHAADSAQELVAEPPPPSQQRAGGGRVLTDDEKRELYHRGFVCVRNVVSPELVQRMYDAIEATPPRQQGGRRPPPPDHLIRAQLMDPEHSELPSSMADLNGHFERLEDWMWQSPYTPAAASPAEELTPVGSISNGLHVDGRRAIGGPGAVACDADGRVSIKPFNNFVFVAVSDLTQPGFGQTHVLPGGHLAMEEFWKWQLSNHGHVGSLGPGWNMLADPVLGLEAARDHLRFGPEHVFQKKGGHKGIPTMVSQWFCSKPESSVLAPDGVTRMPKPVPITLGPGDACVANFNLPHSGSKNDRGPERKQTIFRLKLPGVGKSIPVRTHSRPLRACQCHNALIEIELVRCMAMA